ncbi:SDR family oxidoreductase [Corynebacterium genitalium ATCC 33030]|uniref:Oxidoreductase, short chain dehydrogenase/reductase family protein n=1 Tax=Corynebacterium genitalium ATCC 33030 TaxID=585529 RepID=D7WE50_9CORY|nr:MULTISPECIES: SDR family oxidoreductase [Corynebacterium]MCQ4618606.1 SDR family oxidoreductase [Corynebacterium pseudogenitalium]EFK54404.1 oxidoreductase, short chain dehydrogenase/reductase family protein [Corynebacterium genitalium ATCC 33030]MCQ4623468.1 SDR family oxidoreductase [Corynebacterium sp. CCUG 70398]MCQ4627233.1 SDR family oxidoreductase [Corynebacterium sp. CCUG 65737]UUA90100.1 SDR family oxidoreductase [Corynebacterium genitalium ATCC 33030]
MSLIDPRSKYPTISPPEQRQPHPGLDVEMEPTADIGLESYVGRGRLEGRKALITGGDSGIGAAVAIAYAREGADVAIAYLPEEQVDADRVLAAIEEAGRKAVGIPGDLQDPDTCTKTVQTALDELGGLDILVNNASRQIFAESFLDIDDEEFDATMKTNIYGSFRVTKAALPHLKPGSSILFTSSIQAYDPTPGLNHYAVTKAAMNNMAKGLSMELLEKGIRVNAVAPGPVWTPLQPSYGQPMEKLTEFGQESGLGRAGQPVECAGAYVFLASEEASFISGETLGVTGGALTP